MPSTPALDLPADVGVPGGVDDVDGHASGVPINGRCGAGRGPRVRHGRVLARIVIPFSRFEVAGVHDPLGHPLGLVCGERTRLVQHRVDQRGLAVVDVRDDRDVAEVCAAGHEKSLPVVAGELPFQVPNGSQLQHRTCRLCPIVRGDAGGGVT